MGAVMINCPATGRAIPTGIATERSQFACTPVFFADTYCPYCESDHRWFARDAWVDEPRAKARAA
jgi:hypothetical protein